MPGGIRDKSIGWLRQSRVLDWTKFGLITASGTTLAGTGPGAPVTGEVVDGASGLQLSVAADKAAAWHLDLLRQADIKEEIGVRVLYTVVGAPVATDAITWLVTYNQADAGAVVATPATALNTAIAAQANGGTTALQFLRTSRGVINANTFDKDAKAGSFLWGVESDAITTYDAAQVHFLGLEYDFIPQLCINPEMDLEYFKTLAAVNGA